MKKCPSSIQCPDSNPRPLDCESLPITTRPGLPPNSSLKCYPPPMLIWLSSQTCTSVKRNMNAVVTTGGYNIWNYHFFFLNGPTPASFCLCSFFSNTIFTEKNYRLQRGSNSERLSTRRERWPLEHHNHGPNFHIFLCRKVPQVNCTLSILKYFMRDNERQT